MTIEKDNLLQSILDSLDRIQYVKADDIPGIDLYMDQVTTFMDSRLRSSARHPDEDKVLTKTMINNYAKNDLLPPPLKKKYSKEHVIMLLFIYYYKGVLSINDIQTILSPITESLFQNGKDFNVESVYRELVEMEEGQVSRLKKDVIQKFRTAEEMFENAPEENREFLKRFSFMSLLAFDVYVKKLIIEKMIDELQPADVKETGKEKKESRDRKDGKEKRDSGKPAKAQKEETVKAGTGSTAAPE